MWILVGLEIFRSIDEGGRLCRWAGTKTVSIDTVRSPGICRKILDVDLMQTVHALARKTCYTENAHVCQLVFC